MELPLGSSPRSVPLGEREGKATVPRVSTRGLPTPRAPPGRVLAAGRVAAGSSLAPALLCPPTVAQEALPWTTPPCRRRHPETHEDGTLLVTCSEIQTWARGRRPAASAPGPPTLTPYAARRVRVNTHAHTHCRRLGPTEGDTLHAPGSDLPSTFSAPVRKAREALRSGPGQTGSLR